MVMTVLGWVVFGFIVGAIARFLIPGQQAMSWFMTAVLGVIGSLVGGGLSWLLFGTADGRVSPAGWIMSIVGAIVVVLLFTRIRGPRLG